MCQPPPVPLRPPERKLSFLEWLTTGKLIVLAIVFLFIGLVIIGAFFGGKA